jgi:hypothetical protein
MVYVCMKIFNFTDVEGRDSVSAMNPIYTYGHDFSRHLAQGLADNWSQVRKHYSFTSIAEYTRAPLSADSVICSLSWPEKFENLSL